MHKNLETINYKLQRTYLKKLYMLNYNANLTIESNKWL